jgi:hypothetical protein
MPRIKASLVVLVLSHYHAEDTVFSFGLRGCGLGG